MTTSYLKASIFSLLVAGCTTMDPSPDAGSPGAPPVVLTGTPVLATAPLGMGDARLGTTVDSLFNQVNGDAIFAPRADGAGSPVHTTVDQINIGWVQAEDTNQLAANLAGWGLVSTSLDASNTTRYMSMRASQIDYYEDVDLTATGSVPPPSATYFVSRIYYGHNYEALFSGSASTFTAAVSASLPQASGSIMATASADNLSATNVGRGLVPKNGDAIFAESQSDVMASYSASGPSVPIYVEYRLVPGVADPAATAIPWQSATKATVAIDEIDVFHNGSLLDASKTAWTISASCSVNGAIVEQNDPVWTDTSVTAGGFTIDFNGFGPQDPDAASPSTTYGRYAGLTYSTAIPIATGNQLRCDLVGQRTDRSPAIALPPVSIIVPVDTSRNVDARIGNFDTGTSLDYEIHYTVKYSPN